VRKIKTLKTTKILAYVLVGTFLLYLNSMEISYSKSFSPEQFIQEGKSLFEKGDYEQSLQKLSQAEAYFKSVQVKLKAERLAEIYFWQGLNFAKQGNEKISKAMFKRFLHYSPDLKYDTSLMDDATKEIFTEAKIELEKEFSPQAMGMQGEQYGKKGGSTAWIVLAVIAIAAVGVLAYFLLKKDKDEEEEFGRIEVKSSPTGADIWLDGEDTGKTTNATLSDVSPGTHTLKLVKTGYEDWEDTVSVNKGETTVVNATLVEETKFGKIQVKSVPTGADIWLDGEDTGEKTDKIIDVHIISNSLLNAKLSRLTFKNHNLFTRLLPPQYFNPGCRKMEMGGDHLDDLLVGLSLSWRREHSNLVFPFIYFLYFLSTRVRLNLYAQKDSFIRQH